MVHLTLEQHMLAVILRFVVVVVGGGGGGGGPGQD